MDMNPLQSGCRILKVNELILPSGGPSAAWTPTGKKGFAWVPPHDTPTVHFDMYTRWFLPFHLLQSLFLLRKLWGQADSWRIPLSLQVLAPMSPSQQGPGPPPNVIPRPPNCTHQGPLPELQSCYSSPFSFPQHCTLITWPTYLSCLLFRVCLPPERDMLYRHEPLLCWLKYTPCSEQGLA